MATLNQTLIRWRALRDVPFYSDAAGVDRLEVPFEDFPIGTDIEDIWHALEADCQDFSAGDAMQGKYRSM